MKTSNITLNELLTKKAKLTFLVGAGCSVDAPSCLPAGRPMMEAIIRYSCVESEVEKIMNLKELRFEQLVEIVRDQLDPELKIIDFYGECDKPNTQHLFLAEMIKKGHFVITTNFDFLIERALLQSDVRKKNVVVVITKDDFEKYNNPKRLFKKGKKAVYKIHGSTKNIITGEDTKKSLVATIQAFGSNKEGLNVFQVEPFKRPLFDAISNGRSLVIMGYSGSDDFDVVPTLQILKNLKDIVWINYVREDGGKEHITEIDITTNETNRRDKVDQILLDLKRTNNQERVFRVNVNTTRAIEDMLGSKLKPSSDRFSLNPMDWLKENVKTPSELIKYYITTKIFLDFHEYEDLMRSSMEMRDLAEKEKNLNYKSIALECIGRVYKAQGDYPEALKQYEEALKIDEELGDLSGKAEMLNGIGLILKEQGEYHKAVKRYEEALKIAEQMGDLSSKAVYLNNIGLILREQGNYPEALKRYEEALKIAEQLGELSLRATYLNNIGVIYGAQGDYPEAMRRYEQALKIADQLADFIGKFTYLNNIALIYSDHGDYPEALKRYEEALKIADQLGVLSAKATLLNNIGEISRSQGDYNKALKLYEEALNIAEQLGDLSSKACYISNIGAIHDAQGNYPEAVRCQETTIQILTALGLGESPIVETLKDVIKTLKSKMNK